MSLNVTIPPKLAAVDSATTAQTRASPVDSLVLHIYCDGSYKRGLRHKGIRAGAGIGIVVNYWLPRDTTKQRTSKACFIRCDRDDNNNTTEAFALAEGAHVALDQIEINQKKYQIRSTDRIEVIFWSDSVTILAALGDRARFRTLSKKSRHLLDIIKLKAYELEDLRADVSVQFRWYPEECVEPHATADHLSKKVRLSGGSTASKAVDLFKSGPHRSIESAIFQRRESAEHPLSPLQQEEDEEVGPHASDSGNPDPYAFIEMAALELPTQHKEVILAAIELQKKVNTARTQDATQDHKPKDQASETEGQVYESDDQFEKSEGQFHDPKDQDDEASGRVDGLDGQSHEPGQPGQYDGHIDDNEDLSRHTEGHNDESRSSDDGHVDDEPEMAEEASPNRMLAMWAWVGRSWVDRRQPRV